jgi:type I restriction enzyme S subunit
MSSNSQTSAAEEEAKSMLVPKLRFPDFRGAEGWTEKPLKAAAHINPANGGLPESFVYIDLESVDAGELKAKERICRVGAPSRAQRLVERGDIIYQVVRPYQRNNLLCEFDDDENYVASTGYAQLRAKGSNRFLYQSIHSDSFVGRVIAKCTGSNYPAINSSDLAEIHLPIPPTLSEQQKIAECLCSVDELMAAQARKVDALKTYKKGLMQQLFPRESETQPRLRFPVFQNAEEWEEGMLISLSNVPLSNGVFNDPKKVGTGYKLINVSDMYIETTIDENNLSLLELTPSEFEVNQVLTGDIFFTRSSLVKSGIAVSNIYLGSSSNVTYDGHLIRFRANTSMVIPLFAHYLFKTALVRTQLIARGKTATMTTIGQADVSSVSLFYPDTDEQQRIASCLSSLDDLITAETQKLEAIKSHKKGLMQLLFPSLEHQL